MELLRRWEDVGLEGQEFVALDGKFNTVTLHGCGYLAGVLGVPYTLSSML